MVFWPISRYFLAVFNVLWHSGQHVCNLRHTFCIQSWVSTMNGLQLVNGVSVLNGFLAHFMAIFSCFWSFFAAYLCNVSTFVVCLKQCLPFLSNLQVNFNELANIYPTALFPPNIYISNLVFCMVIYLYIYGCIEYYAEY